METAYGHCAHPYIQDSGFKLNRIPTLCLEDKHKVSQIQTDKELLTLRKTEWLEQMYPCPLCCLDARKLQRG